MPQLQIQVEKEFYETLREAKNSVVLQTNNSTKKKSWVDLLSYACQKIKDEETVLVQELLKDVGETK